MRTNPRSEIRDPKSKSKFQKSWGKSVFFLRSQKFHLGSFEGNLKVIWGVMWGSLEVYNGGWNVAKSQMWRLDMKECSKYFCSRNLDNNIFLVTIEEKKRWNFDFGETKIAFRFWDFVFQKVRSSFRFSDFELFFKNFEILQISDFQNILKCLKIFSDLFEV